MLTMRRTAVLCGAVLLAAGSVRAEEPAPSARPPRDGTTATSAGVLPLSFERTGDEATPTFVSRRPTHTLTLTRKGAALTLSDPSAGAGRALRMHLVDANRAADMRGLEPLPGRVYHATPASRGTLAGNLAYARVQYDEVYPGIDVVYYGNERLLEFDFLVDANRDPRAIRLAFSGADRMQLRPDGELALTIGGDEIRLKKPHLYQEREGVRREVVGGYRIVDARSHEVAFDVGAYDRTRPLVIDPTIVFATYRGSALADAPRQIRVNAIGETYLFADTRDPSTLPLNHPHQAFPLAAPQAGFGQCFLTKLSRDGRAALYTVIFEGAGCEAMDLAPAGAGSEPKVHLQVGTGIHYQRTLTEETGGSVRLDRLQGAYDACELGSCGPVQWMRADAAGNVYLIIAHTPPGMTAPDFVLELRKVDGQGQLVGAIELIRPPIDVQPGGNYVWDQITGLDIDESGHAYVVGIGASPGLITPTATAFQSTRPSGDVCSDPLRQPCFDAFILDVDTTSPGAFAMAYASYLGGAHDDRAFGVAWDRSSDAVFVTGTSRSSNFPTTPGSHAPQPPGGFLVKLDLTQPAPSSQLVFGTFLAVAGPTAITVLPGGLAAIVGQADDAVCSGAGCFPLVQSLFPARFQRNRPFLSVFSADGAALPFSTFLDDRVDADGFVSAVASNGSATVYAAMITNDPSLATPGALQPSPTGDYDTLVQAIDVADLLAPNDAPEIVLTPATLTVALDTPSGATVPLICGRLFTCAIADADGDPLTDIVWLGPNRFRLERGNNSPVPATQAGIVPGSFIILPPGAHTFTLLARDARGGIGTATLTINVSAHNTPVGSNQRVVLRDARFLTDDYRPLGSDRPFELTFSDVTTAGLTWLASRSDLAPAPPPNLQAGSPPYYYDLQSTAAFGGIIRLCVNTRGMSFARPQSELQIFAATGETWTPLGNQAAPTADLICGDTATLGTFAIFYPQVPETAIATFAGTGVAENAIDGPDGDPRDDFAEGVAATQSTLTRPGRLARDGAGNLYVADNGSLEGSRIRRIEATGTVSTIVPAGVCDGFAPIAVDPAGQVVYCVQANQSSGQHDIVQINVADLASTLVASAPEVLAMVLDASGNLFYSDGAIHRVPAGGGSPQLAFAFDDRGGALTLPYFDRAWTLAFQPDGHLLAGGMTLIRISPGADGSVNGSGDESVAQIAGIPGVSLPGYAEPFSGDGLPAAQANLIFTYQMIVASDGAVIFTDQSTRIRRIDPGADGVVNGGPGEIVRTIAGYFGSTIPSPSAFATSEYGDFRGLLEGPASPRSFIVASHGAHKLQRFGIPAEVSVERRADLALAVQADAQGYVNTPVTYRVVVTNHGPAAATNASVSMPVPIGITEVTATSTAGLCVVPLGGIGQVVCEGRTITPGSSVVILIRLTPPTTGELTATFTATAAEDDPVPANNSVTTSVAVAQPVDLAVAVTAAPSQVHALQPFTYTVTVSSLTAAGTMVARLNATLAPNLRFDGATTTGVCELLGNELTCDIEPFAGHQTTDIRIAVTPLTVGTLTSTFAVSNPEGDLNQANNARSVDVLVDGIVIGETIRVSDGVAVTPAVLIPITETIRVSDGPPTPTALGPSLSIQQHILDDRGVAHAAATLDAGQTVRFRLRVSNLSTLQATIGPVTITDVLDGRLGFVAAASDPRCVTTAAQRVVCAPFTPLAPGGSDDFLIAARIAHDAAPPNQTIDIVNRATVATANDEDANDDTASVTLTVRGVLPPNLFLTKTVAGASVSPGDLVTFTLTVTNRRNASGNPLAPPDFGSTLGPITITDTLEPRLSYVPVGSDPRCTAVGQVISCQLTSAPLPPGGTMAIAIGVRIADDAAPVGGQVTIANTAVVAALGDADLADNTSQATVRVQGPPAGTPTNPGAGVVVRPVDSTNVVQPITVRFGGVTAAGYTTAVPIVPTPPAPPRFQFRGAVYDIATTATVVPPIEVCFSDGPFSLLDSIWHAGAILPPGAHTLRTMTQLCATVSSLSPFGVVTLINQAPTAHAGVYPPFEALSPAGAVVTLTGSGDDPDGDPMSFVWTEGAITLGTGAQISVPLAIGVHDLTLTVADSYGARTSSTTRIVVVDTRPPTVTAPGAITIPATEAGGARAAAWPALATFLTGATATDAVDASPVRLPAMVGATIVDAATLFPIGKTTVVTFRVRDASGNVGTATSSVTVILGVPKISIQVAQTGVVSGNRRFVDLRISNTGTGNARHLAMNFVGVFPLQGHAFPRLVLPVLPLAIGSLDAGHSTTVRLMVDVPPRLQRIGITESGTFRNVKGTVGLYVEWQELTP